MSAKVIVASIALSGFLFAGAASAQMGPSHDPATAPAGAYEIEPAHTQVLFDVDHMGFTKYYGQFSGLSGSLTLDPKAPSASALSVSIPTASVTTPSEKLTSEIRSPMFLDAPTYPTITFVSKSVTLTSPTTATIVGDLTLHGVTHPITLSATFHGGGVNMMTKKYSVGFDATGHFNRADFGVKALVPMISDDVEITIAAAFNKTS